MSGCLPLFSMLKLHLEGFYNEKETKEDFL